jgi:hypothetical protein
MNFDSKFKILKKFIKTRGKFYKKLDILHSLKWYLLMKLTTIYLGKKIIINQNPLETQ